MSHVRCKPVADEAVKAVLRRMKIPTRCFLRVDGADICTTQGTILDAFTAPRMAAVDRAGAEGRNATGHYLPPSGR